MYWRPSVSLTVLAVLALLSVPTIAAANSQTSRDRRFLVAQSATTAAQAENSTNHLPFVLGGGAAAVALVGGAVALYKLGRRSGKQEATVNQAVSEYRTLVDLAPAEPSGLEEELYGLKSAQPTVVDDDFVTQLNEFDNAFDVEQLDAAFAAVNEADLPAAQQVLPLDLPESVPAVGEVMMQESAILVSHAVSQSVQTAEANLPQTPEMRALPTSSPVHFQHQAAPRSSTVMVN